MIMAKKVKLNEFKIVDSLKKVDGNKKKFVGKVRKAKVSASLKLLSGIKKRLLAKTALKGSSSARRGDIGRILSIKDSVVIIEG